MNNDMAFIYAIIGSEVLSLLCCLVLLTGGLMQEWRTSKRTRMFILLVISTMAGCFFDLLSWVWDGHSELNSYLFVTTLLSMIMTFVSAGLFLSYFFAYVSERKTISNAPEKIGWIGIAVCIIATFTAAVSGKLFVFRDGCFSEEPFYTVYVIANAGYLLIGIILITKYRDALDRYDKIAAYAYVLIPMTSALIGLFVEGWDFSYPAVMVSLLILFIMLQSDRTKKLEEEGTAASYQAAHDELTGLYNRSAYQNRLGLMKLKEENCGIIFSDLNGLKYTNDTFGHEAGDRLLIHYARSLEGMFRKNDIYRISGDEFICIIEAAPEDVFRKRADELKSILNRESPPLACVGSAYGSTGDMESIVRDAEVEMYAEKKIVHERYPKTRRANNE